MSHDPLWITFIKALVLCLVLLGAFAYMTVIERRLLGRFQHRYGPNRVGPLGALQPIADAIKTIFKEDLVMTSADKFVYVLAPETRYQVLNYPTKFAPTNLTVDFKVKERMGEFYAGLHDLFLQKNPGTFLAEYVWQAGGCGQPCAPRPAMPR